MSRGYRTHILSEREVERNQLIGPIFLEPSGKRRPNRTRFLSYIPQIDIYNDAAEITDPGWFIDGQEPEAYLSEKDRSSLSRNELIVDTMHKSGDIEAYGTGFPRIKDACVKVGVRFEYRRVPIGTCLIFHRNDAFSENPKTKVRESSGKIYRQKSFWSLNLSNLADRLHLPRRWG